MKFNSKLIYTKEQESMKYDSSIKGCYNTTEFVIRLSDDIRNQLDEKIKISPEKFQAFSTYLHENIHWWQHVGSNFGFLLSISFPTFATTSFGHLRNLLDKKISYKSLLEYERRYFAEHGINENTDLNIIINNYYDIEYARQFCLDNKNISKIIRDKRFFLSIGHCYMILWSSNISILSKTIGDHKILPNVDIWFPKFTELNNKQVKGFYPDSSYPTYTLGIRAIYEGQAVFNQVLYLSNVFKENNIIFKDFVDNGLLHGIYLEAFNTYLKIIEEEQPFFIDQSLIGLFLLICDIAINPTNGFPIDIYDYENFIIKNDPGIRFINICYEVLKNKEYALKKCKELTKETYIELSSLINNSIRCKCSYKIIEDILKWGKSESIKNLLREETIHKYENNHLPLRLFLAKFIRFQEDKYENPHFFCWIGYHIPNANSHKVMELFVKHKALFMEDEDGGIKPTIQKAYDKEDSLNTFDMFYTHIILYELILKWISEDGPFKLNYKWLFGQRNDENISNIKKFFKNHFNIELEEVQVLKK